MAKAFNMQVIGVKKTPDFDAVLQAEAGAAYTCKDLPKAIAVSDFIVLVIPLNKDTFDFIGPQEFKVMKKGAYLVNVSRGPNVNREALMQALADGTLAGFATDVFWDAPADPSDPLLNDDRVVFSPHLGAYTAETVTQSARAGRENIDRLIKGEPLLNVVNM